MSKDSPCTLCISNVEGEKAAYILNSSSVIDVLIVSKERAICLCGEWEGSQKIHGKYNASGYIRRKMKDVHQGRSGEKALLTGMRMRKTEFCEDHPVYLENCSHLSVREASS